MAVSNFGYIFLANSEKSQNVVQRDLQALSSSYTRSYGFVMDKGQGAELWDVDGNRFIDFAAGIAVMATGYAHPRIVETIKRQADRFLHIGGTDFFYPEQVHIAEKLQQIVPIHGAQSPQDKRVFLCNSGTEAIEAALKLARYRAGRQYIIGFYGGFHGRSMGALSVTASKYVQRANYPFIPGGVVHIDYPGKFDCEQGDGSRMVHCDAARYLEEVVFKKKIPPQEVAAILVEPIQGEGGYVVPTDNFLADLRALCDRYGILLIADEIQAGMGRTGKWLAIDHWDVQPDIVCMAKGLGSGFPIGAIVAHQDVMNEWVSGAHASTFGGNPMACEVAATTIDIIQEEGLLDHVTELGAYTQQRLQALQTDHTCIRRVDGKGFMIGLEFVTPEGQPDPALRNRLVDECFLRGLITLGCGESSLRIAPPLVITRDLIDEGLTILEDALRATGQNCCGHPNCPTKS